MSQLHFTAVMTDRSAHRVLLLGHSFIRRLPHDVDWGLTGNIDVKVRGFGGLTVPRLVSRLASALQAGEFDIVYLEIGSNDLASPCLCDADSLADEILVLAHRLTNHVK